MVIIFLFLLQSIIDFRDTAFESCEGLTRCTVQGITLTANLGVLWHDSVDGIGIIWEYEDDEIEAPEILGVESDYLITGFGVADLFWYVHVDPAYWEVGRCSLDGKVWNYFLPSQDQIQFETNGETYIEPAGFPTSHFYLSALGKMGEQGHELTLQYLVVDGN